MSLAYQSGVIAEANSDALFITLNVDVQQLAAFRTALAGLPDQVQQFKQRFSSQAVHAVIAIGSEFWDQVDTQRPVELANFPRVTGQVQMPITPVDVLLHLRSDRRDITYALARLLLSTLGQTVCVVEEVSGFRYLDSRDLTGFVDGTENPQGDHRKEVALVGDEDAAFAGGSYIHLQRYVHNLQKWEALSLKRQEDTMGRTKLDNVEYGSDEKPLTAHTKRTSLKTPAGESVEILRHSMPYGSLQEAGLVFASYCRTPQNFTLMLKSMVEGDGHGHTDQLMQYTQAVTGQAFFAPSLRWFQNLSA